MFCNTVNYKIGRKSVSIILKLIENILTDNIFEPKVDMANLKNSEIMLNQVYNF